MCGPRQKALCMLVFVTLVSACSVSESLVSRLDEATGVTVVSMEVPIVLARPTRLAVAARDYAYLGPVEINRMGRREYFLWVGLASTVDRPRVSEPPPRAMTLALVVDGLPMIVPLTDWNPDLEAPPYDGTTPVYASLAGRASFDQIMRIAAAESVVVHIITDSGGSLDYRLWDGDWPDWATFTARSP